MEPTKGRQAFGSFGLTRFFLVARRPSPQHLSAIEGILRNGTEIYLSADPRCPSYLAGEGAKKLLASGFNPVPHVAARTFADEAKLDCFLAQLNDVGVRRVFVLAGDVDQPAGALENSLQVIQSGILAKHGFADIDVAGYPEGHPYLPNEVLRRSLTEKICAAKSSDLEVHIASQFCFDPCKIIDWIQAVRESGFDNVIRVGIPTAAKLSILSSYAVDCGVRIPYEQLQKGMQPGQEAIWTPEHLLTELNEAFGKWDPGAVTANFFAFGGLVSSARWAASWADRAR